MMQYLTGQIVFRPISGKFLKDYDVCSKMDPYLIITYGWQKFKTRTHHEGGKTPSWNDCFTFNRTSDYIINITAFD